MATLGIEKAVGLFPLHGELSFPEKSSVCGHLAILVSDLWGVGW